MQTTTERPSTDTDNNGNLGGAKKPPSRWRLVLLLIVLIAIAVAVIQAGGIGPENNRTNQSSGSSTDTPRLPDGSIDLNTFRNLPLDRQIAITENLSLEERTNLLNQLTSAERTAILKAPANQDLGVRKDVLDAINKLENIKKDPLGPVNSITGKNHYAAARLEAQGTIVAYNPRTGRPYSHVGDLQRAYDGLQSVRRVFELEIKNPPDTITERGRETLKNRYQEVQELINRLRDFLNSIGYGPTSFPPYHSFP